MRPSDQQIEIALKAAERMHSHDLDPHYLSRTLRFFYARNQSLEELLLHADRFLRFGMSEQEMAQLRRLVIKLREAEEHDDSDPEITTSMLL